MKNSNPTRKYVPDASSQFGTYYLGNVQNAKGKMHWTKQIFFKRAMQGGATKQLTLPYVLRDENANGGNLVATLNGGISNFYCLREGVDRRKINQTAEFKYDFGAVMQGGKPRYISGRRSGMTESGRPAPRPASARLLRQNRNVLTN